MEYYPKNKDWESWPGVGWESDEDEKLTKQPEPVKDEQPRYENFTIREADGSLTHCSVRVSSKPVYCGSMMV